MEMCRRAARVDIAQPSPPSGDGWYDTLEQFGRRLSAMEYRLGRWASRSNTLRWLRMAPLMVLIGGLTMACSVPASSPPTLAAPTHQLPPTVTDADVAQRARPSVVRLIARGGDIGSGVRVSTGILTNAHVVAETERVTVQGADGAMYPGFVARRDALRDLALIVSEAPATALAVASARARPGETLLVLGYPLGDRLGNGVSLARGVVSAIRVDEPAGRVLIQTDAALNPGNSGGPMLNQQGEVLAVVSFGIRGSEGLGFGIAAETIRQFLDGASSAAAGKPDRVGSDTPTAVRLERPPSEIIITPAPPAAPIPAAPIAIPPVVLSRPPSEIIITLQEMGPGWKQSDSKGSDSDGWATRRFEWIGASGGDRDGAESLFAQVWNWGSPAEAMRSLRRSPPADGVEIAHPSVADVAVLWERIDGFQYRVVVGRTLVELEASGNGVTNLAGRNHLLRMVGRVIDTQRVGAAATATAVGRTVPSTATALANAEARSESPRLSPIIRVNAGEYVRALAEDWSRSWKRRQNEPIPTGRYHAGLSLVPVDDGPALLQLSVMVLADRDSAFAIAGKRPISLDGDQYLPADASRLGDRSWAWQNQFTRGGGARTDEVIFNNVILTLSNTSFRNAGPSLINSKPGLEWMIRRLPPPN